MSRRRSPGEGSITLRRDGRWQASLQVGGRRVNVYGRTRAEAAAKLDALRQQYRTAGHLPERHTLGELLAAWLETGAKRWKPRTLANYRHDANLLLAELGSETPLARLSSARIQAILNQTSPRRAQQLHQALHAALGLAVRWDWLPTNPADRVVRPTTHQRQERQWWTAEQCRAFLDGTAGSRWWPLWVVALATSCRLGELLALRWSDVDWEHHVLRVERSGQWVGGRWVETVPKSAAGRRTLALNLLALEALRRQRSQQAQWRLVAGPAWCDAGLVFSTCHGTPLRRYDVARAMRNAVRRLGLPPMTMHGLRHQAASLLLAEGVPLTDVSRRLGHSHVGVTAAVYSHALPGRDRQAAEALERALGG